MQHAGKAGFGFPVRFKIEAANDGDFSTPIPIADHTGADYPNPGAKPVEFAAKECSARFVRVTVTKLWKRDELFCAALRQLEVVSQGRNVALRAKVNAKDSVEGYGWGKPGLTQGLVPASATNQTRHPVAATRVRCSTQAQACPGPCLRPGPFRAFGQRPKSR